MIGWIMECVTSTSFSLSINGSLHGYFKGKRGLRQGDPMSPYLFTLVMEVLTLMLNRKAREYGNFMYHRYCSKLNLINLCFADDLFLFAHGDVDSARVIMDTLGEFKDALGLAHGLPKSTDYFCNVLNHIKIDILNILPFEEGKLPVKYLGVPLVPSRLLYRDCKEIMEKLEQLMRGFLWCQGEMKKGKAKVAWEVAYLPKREGGLGIRRLETLLWEIPIRGKLSWGWRKILQVRQLARPYFWYRLGDGANASAWFDNWCSVSPLADRISNRDIYGAGFNRSAKVWDHMKGFTGLSNIPSDLDSIVGFISRMTKMRSLIQYNVDVRRMEEINADALYDAWKRIDSTKYVQIGGSPPETRRANDLSLFARGHLNYVSVPTDALEEFKNVSDLVPSIPKSNAYFCNVPNVFKVAILNYMPFEEGTLCILVLLIVSILLYCDYMVLIERLQHQITDWKNKFLSFVGRP
ncbi:putative reverse transcriptase domain, reverse transcriptase zinc-binding domain protein [Tanacetum coccineum]